MKVISFPPSNFKPIIVFSRYQISPSLGLVSLNSLIVVKDMDSKMKRLV
jgi:hypothetical protein